MGTRNYQSAPIALDTLMIETLTILSAAAAAGMRTGIPLLIVSLLQGKKFWSLPLLAHIPPLFLLCCLASWSLLEVVASKKLLGQRVLQLVQLAFSPIAGALMVLAVTTHAANPGLVALIGGLLALVLQLVQVGWFYRLGGLPLWAVCLQDILGVVLVLLAFDGPLQGGLIALVLILLALCSAKHWYDWYHKGRRKNTAVKSLQKSNHM